MSKLKVNNILPLPNTDLKIWTGGVTTVGSAADPAVKITLQTSTGYVGVGTTSPEHLLDLRSDASNGAGASISQYITNAGDGPNINLKHARGTEAAPLVLADGDSLGAIDWWGHDGTNFEQGARIAAQVDGSPAGDATDMPGRLSFYTTADGSDSPTLRLSITNAGNVGIGTSSPNCMLHVAGSAAFSGPSETFVTFSDGDGTPSVSTGNIFKHHASTQTITMFDDGVCGQIITVISTAAITYDVTSTNLKGGSADIVTASGDVTMWVFDGTSWYLLSWMDVSANLSSGGF